MSNRYSEVFEQAVRKNIDRLMWKCTGCCFAEECDNDSPRDFSRYCDNLLTAALREEETFDHPTQLKGD